MTQNTEQNTRTRDEQITSYPKDAYIGQYSGKTWVPALDEDDLDPDRLVEGPVRYVRCDIADRQQKEAEARGAEEQRRKDAEGYLFDNPDTGTEYLPYHPVESGECPYAENIREATSTELLSALIASWQGWKEDRDEKEKISSTVAALGRDLNDWRSRFWKADNERVRYRECMTDCVALLNRIKSGGLTRIWLKNCLEESPQDTGEE